MNDGMFVMTDQLPIDEKNMPDPENATEVAAE